MQWQTCALLALLAIEAAAAGRGDPVRYVGGTVAELPRAAGFLDATGNLYFRFQTHGTAVEIPYDNVNVLEYGQKVDRRYIMAVTISPLLLLSKKRQHFLTIGYSDEQGRQQALVFEVEKGHIRSLLASLEAKTGRRVESQDPEARKARSGG